jgi:hypothetical protein
VSPHNHIGVIGCTDRVKRTAILSTRDTKQRSSKDENERAVSVPGKYLHVSWLFSYFVEVAFVMWTGLVWLRIGTGGGLL